MRTIVNYCFFFQNQYGLACDEWRRSLIGTVTTFGTLTALPITGYISDRWGRRVALTINAFNTGWIGLTRYWADTYLGFVLSQFAEATFGCGLYSSIYILCEYHVTKQLNMNIAI